MNKDIVLNGVHIGEHGFDPDKVIDEIYERCVKPGLNFVTIRPGYMGRRIPIPQHYFIEWAKYMAENKIYFIFLYTIQHAPDGRESHFDKETVDKMREIAGEYYIGDMIGETGSSFACKLAGYFNRGEARGTDTTQITEYPDMKAAHEGYVADVSKYIEIDKKLGVPAIVSVEATGLNKYNAEAGVTIPMLELMCGSPDVLVSSLRGVARAYDSEMWGTYVAHEWYGGMRHDDILKRKRLELAYKYAYLAGTNALCLESGDELVSAYGYNFKADSELCGEYRKVMCDMMDYIKSDKRPVGGPKVKVAFVSGRHDAYGGWGGSSIWNQFDREEWGHSDAEHSWRILDEIGTKRTWNDIANFGDTDFSAAPAYGMYDIVPIEADAEHLLRYDYLIFLGWNSMTEEDMDKLYEYVNRGGRLLMSAAHLNTSTVRNGEFSPVSEEKIKKLFGCSFTEKSISSNAGIKFRYTSLDENAVYPGSRDLFCDPIYSAGYVNWAEFELCGGVETALLTDAFVPDKALLPAVIENKVGDGVATLVTALDYPGKASLLPLYRAIVRELVTASARKADIRVIGSDRLRWSVYEGDKVYLLNTDYDMPITVKLIKGEKETTVTLDSLELKSVQI
ncbi:MAG: hypothetical protein E7441_10980 [Ruminococcaceae bacterium]|nr:hypothetical protein [Oscillospiraceae bacterium]